MRGSLKSTTSKKSTPAVIEPTNTKPVTDRRLSVNSNRVQGINNNNRQDQPFERKSISYTPSQRGDLDQNSAGVGLRQIDSLIRSSINELKDISSPDFLSSSSSLDEIRDRLRRQADVVKSNGKIKSKRKNMFNLLD